MIGCVLNSDPKLEKETLIYSQYFLVQLVLIIKFILIEIHKSIYVIKMVYSFFKKKQQGSMSSLPQHL